MIGRAVPATTFWLPEARLNWFGSFDAVREGRMEELDEVRASFFSRSVLVRATHSRPHPRDPTAFSKRIVLRGQPRAPTREGCHCFLPVACHAHQHRKLGTKSRA